MHQRIDRQAVERGLVMPVCQQRAVGVDTKILDQGEACRRVRTIDTRRAQPERCEMARKPDERSIADGIRPVLHQELAFSRQAAIAARRGIAPQTLERRIGQAVPRQKHRSRRRRA